MIEQYRGIPVRATTVNVHTADRAATVKITEKREGERDASRKERVEPNSVGTFHATDILALSIEEDAPTDEGDAA